MSGWQRQVAPLFVVGLLLWSPLHVLGQPAVGQITAASEAHLQRGVMQSPATPGLLLYVGDVLTTVGTESRVAVTMVDQTKLALGPKSRLVLRQFRWDVRSQQGHAVAELPTGTLAVQSGGWANGTRAIRWRWPHPRRRCACRMRKSAFGRGRRDNEDALCEVLVLANIMLAVWIAVKVVVFVLLLFDFL